MRTEKVDTLILGAGPAGLAAGYALAKAGEKPVLLENNKVSGGLMRSIQRGQFSVDVGRKELYSRIPEVDRLWTEILGRDYRPYPHRVGILYDGHIFETDRSYRGFRRGIPWSILLGCGIDWLWYRAKAGLSKPRNLEEYSYRKRGPEYTKLCYQRFHEKFTAKRWKEMPVPPTEEKDNPVEKKNWRHPAKGTGQICELLERHILGVGGRFQFEAKVTEIGVSQGRIATVSAEIGEKKVTYQPLHVVSSLPIELLGQFLLQKRLDTEKSSKPADFISTVLVYLFLDENPRFPHAWLNVTCPKMKAGRITNYTAFNGDMVPKGQTSLCVEFFCVGADALLELSNEEIQELALEECVKSGLVDAKKCLKDLDLVLRLPGINAATKWQDWLSEERLNLFAELKQFENLYNVNRPGTDKATYAGLEAAAAILSGDRLKFVRRTEPTRSPVG